MDPKKPSSCLRAGVQSPGLHWERKLSTPSHLIRVRKQRSAPVTPGPSLGVTGGPARGNLSPEPCPHPPRGGLQIFSPVTFQGVERMTQAQGQQRALGIIPQTAASNGETQNRTRTLFLTLLSMWPPSSVQAAEKPTVSNPSSRSRLLPNRGGRVCVSNLFCSPPSCYLK